MNNLNVVAGQVEPIFKPIDGSSELVLTGAQSTVINALQSQIVLVSAVGDTYIKFGVSPTASATDSMFLAGGNIVPFNISAGFKISTFGASITITK